MKKLVLVVAMFMFVCGGSFLVKAQSSAEAVTAPTEINATVVNDTVVKDTVTKKKTRPQRHHWLHNRFLSMIRLSQTLHQKTNRLSLSRNNLANNMQDIVCRRIVSKKKSHPYFRLFRGWLFYYPIFLLLFCRSTCFQYRICFPT